MLKFMLNLGLLLLIIFAIGVVWGGVSFFITSCNKKGKKYKCWINYDPDTGKKTYYKMETDNPDEQTDNSFSEKKAGKKYKYWTEYDVKTGKAIYCKQEV